MYTVFKMNSKLAKRVPLRDDIAGVLRSWCADNRLKPGANVDEAGLAQELGVSRTPLREALLHLSNEGLIRFEMHRGYFVTEIGEDVVRQLYPIIGALESLAVRTGGEKLISLVPELRELNQALRAGEPSKADLFEIDREWHRSLTATHGNEALLDLIESTKLRAMRFDGSTRRGLAARSKSWAEHDRIIDAIAEGSLVNAAALLESHWVAGAEVVIGWLQDQRNAADPSEE